MRFVTILIGLMLASSGTAGTVAVSTFMQGLLGDSSISEAQETLSLFRRAVIMTCTGNGTWVVYDIDGQEVDISGSTTNGLDEAFDAMIASSANLYVYGGGKGPGTPGDTNDIATIICTTTVEVPPLEGHVVRVEGVRIIWPLAQIGSDPGMLIDSCMLASLYFEGEFIYYGTGNALEFAPTSELSTDASGPGIVANHFSFNAIGSAGNKCVEFYPSGGIACNTFEFLEMNMDSAPATAQYFTSDATSNCSFSQNIITATFLHGCTNTTDATIDIAGGSYSYANRWYLSLAEPNEGVGLQTDSRNDIYILDISPAGNTLTGVVFDTNATQNEVTIQRFADAAYGTLYTDNSMAQDNLVRWGSNIATPLMLAGNKLYFEGATADGFETLIQGGDVTSDVTWTLPVADGNANDVLYTNGAGELSWTAQANSRTVTGELSWTVQANSRTVTIDISNAQIKALASTAKELVASPGANKLLEFVSAVLLLDYSGGALSEPSAPDDLAIEYDNGSGTQIATWDSTGFITSRTDAMQIVNAAGVRGGASAVLTARNVNKNIALVNTGANYRGAGSTSHILVIVTYRVHDSLGL